MNGRPAKPLLPAPIQPDPGDGRGAFVELHARTPGGGLATVLVSPRDYRRFAPRALYLTSTGYAAFSVWDRARKQRGRVRVHRAICRVPKGLHVDHANREPLDCRRGNLRPATPSQNSANRGRAPLAFSSRFRGVTAHHGRWQASIKHRRAFRFLGAFDDERAAAAAYNVAAFECFGAFAQINDLGAYTPPADSRRVRRHITHPRRGIDMQHSLTFALERVTKGAVRYRELTAAGEPAEQTASIIGTLYVRKAHLPTSVDPPRQITVTLTL